jgi:HK97 family phage prohead protease
MSSQLAMHEFRKTARIRLFGRAVRWGDATIAEHRHQFCLTRAAVTEAMLADPRVALRINHESPDLCTVDDCLELRADERGIFWQAEFRENPATAELLRRVKAGELAGCSIAFLPGRHKMTQTADGRRVREYQSVERLTEISLCDVPAIPACWAGGVRLKPLYFCQQTAKPTATTRRPRRKPRPISFAETVGMRRGRMLSQMLREQGEPLRCGLIGDVSLRQKIDERIRIADGKPAWPN